jgi:hypothetical protein
MTTPTASTISRHRSRPEARDGRQIRLYTSLVGLTALTILVQAVLAGEFLGGEGRDGWVSAHGVVADVSWVLALVTAVVAWRYLRVSHRPLWLGSAGLFVLDLAQTGIGHLITDDGHDGLIVVHIPIALLLFGLTVWLSLRAAQLRR